MTDPPAASEHEPIFKWETIKEFGANDLRYPRRSVSGKMCEIELTSGKTIHVWRSDDGERYFCHALTFGGKVAPGGAISPFSGQSVETILREHYQMIPEGLAMAGDILVWRGIAPETTPHSAILSYPIVVEGQSLLDYSTRLQTKNGILPETNMALSELIDNFYGESYRAYRRK